jgi:hypothetical protein
MKEGVIKAKWRRSKKMASEHHEEGGENDNRRKMKKWDGEWPGWQQTENMAAWQHRRRKSGSRHIGVAASSASKAESGRHLAAAAKRRGGGEHGEESGEINISSESNLHSGNKRDSAP